MKKVLILGSTGSIGKNALKVINLFKEEFKVVGLVAGKNKRELLKQAEVFKPEAVALFEGELPKNLPFKAYTGLKGIENLIKELEFDVCLAAISGSSGILPTYWASKKAERLALANKEALVCAGKFIKKTAREILPVDSEHSAIFQALKSGKKEEVKRIILTASGGPFWNREDLENVKPQDALKHPNWKMGKKITVDSATLMNKGLEVIEAYWLFEVPPKKIEVVIHPQSIVHSLVEFQDGSLISQMGVADMKIPIAYALSYPKRLPLTQKEEGLSLNLFGLKLEFYRPDFKKFPCLNLAYRALKENSYYPIVLNAADEVAVELFLKGQVKFTDIPKIIEETLNLSDFKEPKEIEEVIEIDRLAREKAREISKRWS
ncbi:1-deoxy-D-xylulose-5-phosphate reductoisomerase [Thermovibrio sp.]